MPDTPEPATVAEGRYKVGEICRLADVQPYVLRYWENEFPVLATDRSQPGPRSYSEQDLKVIQRIKTLLYVEGFTIAGAKKRLENELKSGLPETPTDAAPDTATVAPPPLPTGGVPSEAKPRRGRTRPVSNPKKEEAGEGELLEVYDEEVSAPQPPPLPKQASDPSTGVVAPLPDLRLKRVADELKEILAILSRER